MIEFITGVIVGTLMSSIYDNIYSIYRRKRNIKTYKPNVNIQPIDVLYTIR